MHNYMPDRRPLDQWGNPIGTAYVDKAWNELTVEEMKADFEWKSDILRVAGEEVSSATFYQDYLFRELYKGEIEGDYKVLLTEYNAEKGHKLHKVNVDEIDDFLDLSDVALSPCLFHSNWRNKRLLAYVAAFFLDIDCVRPKTLQRFLELFDQGRLLRPTFITNSGSGVHFIYLLDKMFPIGGNVYEANRKIAMEIYRLLYDDVIIREKYKFGQRHWLGQDYRVVGSLTKLQQRANVSKVGDIYTIEELVKHYHIEINPKKKYASDAMKKYATNIAKDLGMDLDHALPDFENSQETYEFIKLHKDAAFEARENRRKEKEKKEKTHKKRKMITWYRNTLAYMRDHTQAGYRFSSMKALAIIAFKEKVDRQTFLEDIQELAAYWSCYDWAGDEFNEHNVEAIIRLFDHGATYSNTSAEKLEEWLGYKFKRIGTVRNGRKRKVHLQADMWETEDGKKRVNVCKENRKIGYREAVNDGRVGRYPRCDKTVRKWRLEHPEGKKADCIKETGLSKSAVYRWWDVTFEEKKAQQSAMQPSVEETKAADTEEIFDVITNMPDDQLQDLLKLLERKLPSKQE